MRWFYMLIFSVLDFQKKQFRCRITHLNCLLLKEINIFYFYFALALVFISHRIFRIHVYSHFAIIFRILFRSKALGRAYNDIESFA